MLPDKTNPAAGKAPSVFAWICAVARAVRIKQRPATNTVVKKAGDIPPPESMVPSAGGPVGPVIFSSDSSPPGAIVLRFGFIILPFVALTFRLKTGELICPTQR